MKKTIFSIIVATFVAGCNNTTLALRSVIHQNIFDGGEKGNVNATPTANSNRVEAPKETNLSDSGKVSLTGK